MNATGSGKDMVIHGINGSPGLVQHVRWELCAIVVSAIGQTAMEVMTLQMVNGRRTIPRRRQDLKTDACREQNTDIIETRPWRGRHEWIQKAMQHAPPK